MPDTSVTRYPYQDSQLPVEQRIEDLSARMSLKDKAGLLFHAMTFAGDIDAGERHVPSAAAGRK